MDKEEILFLNQLVESLEESTAQMEQFYLKKNYEEFNRSKKIILKIQQEIDSILK